MSQPPRTNAQLVIGAVGIAIVTVVVVILIGRIVNVAFIQTFLAVPLGVALGLWFYFSQRPKDDATD